LLENGDVGVGVFPDGEEVLIGGAGFGEGVRLSGRSVWAPLVGNEARPYIGFESVSTRQSEAGQRSSGKVHH
jgi:hypothetical protein